ncbi:MAG: GldG family protein [Spirochaetaceae bacterium]|nr:GldG family protein [Spirochaetaceae bacterium]
MKTTPYGRKLIWILCIFIFVLFFLLINRIYLRIDLTEGRRFSISSATKQLLLELENPVRITYYISPKLKELYPQTRDIGDFLFAYAAESDLVSLYTVDPISEGLEESLLNLGIAGRQIQSVEGGSTQFTTVYSALVIEYLGHISIIPFILTAETLEYELDSRLMALVQQKTRPVLLMAANELSIEQDYSYVKPWLEAAGFSCQIISPTEFVSLQQQFDRAAILSTPLVVFGSHNLSEDQAQAIKLYAESGGSLVMMTSSIKADIYGTWQVEPVKQDFLIPILKEWGISLGQELLADISCFRITLFSDEENPTYESMNYPLWISTLPQYSSVNNITKKLNGMNFFWANPLTKTDSNSEILVYTSPAAWALMPDETHETAFVTNPFMVAQTAQQAGTVSSQYGLALQLQLPDDGGKIIVVSDQYFVSTMMLDYTGASTNLDFLVNSLLDITNENLLLELRNKSQVSTILYKVDEATLLQKKATVLIVTCIVLPLLPTLIALCIFFIKKIRKNRK